MNALFDLLALVTLAGLAWFVWHSWGAAAKRAGTGRLQLLGFVALLGWLVG
jgi:hypothetical protein